MQYKAKKACTLPGSNRFVEQGQIVNLPKGAKPSKYLEPVKSQAPEPAAKEAEKTGGQGPGAKKDEAKTEDKAGEAEKTGGKQ